MKPESLVTKKNVCGHLGNCSPRYLERLMAQGLPHVKVGRRVLFRISEVDDWLDRFRVQSGSDWIEVVDSVLNKMKKRDST